ncbi:hypothetical protein ACFYM5_31335 [Streptomyces sp. NPDC006706]|uniref:hypothetical protein n=1 Tax=Streptomyces sp. NPDC006706 TaxID=3364761 RepID=UPI003684D57A
MIPSKVDDTLPELAPFVHAVQGRRPDDGTWCEAWTVRDVLVHQTTIESDAATRVLLLWGRRPADPTRWHSTAGPEALRRVRTLLGGY